MPTPKKLTKNAALKAIRALGIPANYSAEFKEYKVGRGPGSYFTNSADDALATAKAELTRAKGAGLTEVFSKAAKVARKVRSKL